MFPSSVFHLSVLEEICVAFVCEIARIFAIDLKGSACPVLCKIRRLYMVHEKLFSAISDVFECMMLHAFKWRQNAC